MFDNPNEELKKLENQLLAAEEQSKDDFESFYSDILNEFGPATRPAAIQSSESKQKKPSQSGAAKPKTSGQKKGKKGNSKKLKKQIRALTVILGLETAGVIAIIMWWVLRLL